ncbi:MAG TPA: peptidyl-prolyl cis-trans isomerase [Acidobacteriaceae bacterium]|jgi:peptidyl-prolyl cis-trans isomerase D|nr:peptidyl-prolyl cis-trans isomerase [Acidobacteriaceae bacterium]
MIRLFQQDNLATKIIFGLIIGATIILMVIFLVPGIFNNDDAASNNASLFATVRSPGLWNRIVDGSTPITMSDVQRETRRQMQQQHLPDQFQSFLIARVGQQQVERAVLVREANRLGLQVSDDDLRRELRTGPLSTYLFPDGNFIGQDRYISFVDQFFGVSIAEFETEVKQDLELQRLQSLVTGGVTVSDNALRADYLQQGIKIKFNYAVISADDIKKSINPTDAQLETFFKQGASRYATAVPEMRKLSFIAFSDSDLPGGKPQVTDAEVQSFYNAHQGDYTAPQEVKTRHILIAVARNADAKTDAAAKAKAQDILKQVQAGGNFADLAKKYSDDPGSKDQGGELPMMPTSNLDPAYAQAAMALNPGQTSGLVRSQFGYHIIQTEAKQPAHTKTLAEVHDSIVAQLESERAAAAAQSYAAQLVAQARQQGLDKTAQAHNLHVVTTDYLAHDGIIPTLADSTSLLTAAFGAAKGAAPQSVSTGEGYAVFQVVDVKPAHAPDFATWKPHVLDDYRTEQAPEILNQQLIKLADRAKVLNDLSKAAAEMKIPVQTSDLVGRDAQVQDLGAMSGAASVLFSLPKGAISGPINEGPNGSVAQIVDKQEPTPADIEKNLPATRAKLLEQQRNEVFDAFAGSLMQHYLQTNSIIYSHKQPAGLP